MKCIVDGVFTGTHKPTTIENPTDVHSSQVGLLNFKFSSNEKAVGELLLMNGDFVRGESAERARSYRSLTQ